MKKRAKIIGGVAGLFLLVGIIGACGNDEEVKDVVEESKVIEQVEQKEEPKVTEPKVEEKSEEKTQEKPIAKEEPKEEQKSDDNFTASQKNAIRHAEQYIETMPFSKSGLIEQLEFEGYSTEDAKFAVDNIDVDWREQAVRHAELYIDTMPFSRDGLIEQLKFEGHSEEDSVYAVGQVGL